MSSRRLPARIPGSGVPARCRPEERERGEDADEPEGRETEQRHTARVGKGFVDTVLSMTSSSGGSTSLLYWSSGMGSVGTGCPSPPPEPPDGGFGGPGLFLPGSLRR